MNQIQHHQLVQPERVSPLNIMLTSEVSDTAKLVSSEISTVVKYELVAAFNDVLAFDAVNEFNELFNKV